MSGVNQNLTVSTVMSLLSERLGPVIGSRLAEYLHGLSWTAVLVELDRAKGKAEGRYTESDVSAQLRMLTERLGGLGYPFGSYGRMVSNYAGELRVSRNNWAHNVDFTAVEAWRVADTARLLLELLEDGTGAVGAAEIADAALILAASELGVAPERSADSGGDPKDSEDVEEFPADSEPIVITRDSNRVTPTIGTERLLYEPWTFPSGGDRQVIEDLPKIAAKDQIRAVAAELVAFEGPIQLRMAAKRVAWSFGVGRVSAKNQSKIEYQIKKYVAEPDEFGFVWPSEVDRDSWSEFRPHNPEAHRQVTEISPTEIANALRWVREGNPEWSQEKLSREVLAIFGRSKMTSGVKKQLDAAWTLLDGA